MFSMIRPVRAFAALLLSLVLASLAGGPARAADEFLDPDQAFVLSVRALPDKQVELRYTIAPGYYLYRERFKFSSPDAKLGEPRLPPGKKHYDKALEQNVETYHDQVLVTLPIVSGPKAFTLAVVHQGCADKGLCYPPQLRTVAVTLKAFGADADTAKVLPAGDDVPLGSLASPPLSLPLPLPVPAAAPVGAMSFALAASTAAASSSSVAADGTAAPAAAGASRAPDSSDDVNSNGNGNGNGDGQLASALRGGRLTLIVPLFFVAGLLLSLTPCVLPMVPILSSIIVGQGERVTRGRGFMLALAYSLGMALLYTALGIAAGLLGEGLAAWLQKPWVLASFAALLVVLSLSMFGFYELQLPSTWRDRLNRRGQGLKGGRYAGVFAMGGLSALIVSPCVAAPLAAALLHISRTGDAVLGGLALFMLAIGMSVPLLLVGASAGALLPRAGAWMEQVKHVFGLLLIAVAIYTVQPVLAPLATMIAWGVLLVVGGASLGAFEPVVRATSGTSAGTGASTAGGTGMARVVKGLGLVLALLGALEFVGIASGGRDPAQPLARLALADGAAGAGVDGSADYAARTHAAPRFERVANLAELDRRLQSAGQPVMLDFYADWCVSCKEMESQTFPDAAVRARLANVVLLRADVTANDDDDRALLRRFHLFGPPGLIFFDAQGHEIEGARVVGFQDAPRFLQSLAAAGL